MERRKSSGIMGTGKERELKRADIRTKMKASYGHEDTTSPLVAVAHSASFKDAMLQQGVDLTKTASNRGTGSFTGSGAVSRLAPEIYSPLYQFSNLNLPRDKVTQNAWNRAFYQTNPYVRNAITLHSTYPISKLNIKCEHPKVERFFNDMAEDINLTDVLFAIALEYWVNGEAFPHADFDEENKVWSRIVVQNPDYIVVKRAIVASEPIIFLKADQTLQRIATSTNPMDVRLREQIPDYILHYTRKGAPIPLNNFNVSHLKARSHSYDIRGTSILVSTYKDLMLYDRLRECYSNDTDLLTSEGFKKYDEITEKDKIATFNSKTEEIEYHPYIRKIDYHYEGNMYHFNSGTMDCMVTPNHRMWVGKKKGHKSGYKDFDFIKAEDFSGGTKYRTRAKAISKGEHIEFVDVLGNQIPIDDYLRVLAFVITEGYCHYDEKVGNYVTGVCQKEGTEEQKYMREKYLEFADNINLHCGEVINLNTEGYSKNNPSEIWHGRITNKALTAFVKEQVGSGARNKKIPKWVKELSPDILKGFLKHLVMGDGSFIDTASKPAYRYYTISDRLADDVQEIVFKCGYASYKRIDENGEGKEFWLISWCDSNRGDFPVIHGNSKKSANIDKIPYNDRVWCFEVPNGLFVTRRNGLVTIQGNSKFCQADSMINPITLVKIGGNAEGEYRPTPQDLEFWKNIFEEAQYDKDFKIFTHSGVDVQRVGFSGHVLDIQADLEFIVKNIMVGLMIPPALLDQEWASYSSASVGLEVLRDRYMAFRNEMKRWLERKIFAPISKAQGFFEIKDGRKRLIIPEIEWNKMNLYDLDNYTNVIVQLNQMQPARVSKSTVYRSLDLNYEEEKIKMRKEMIDEMIMAKEREMLMGKTASELRSIDPEEDILEEADQVMLAGQVPATPGAEMGMGLGGEMGLGGGIPGLGGGGGGGGMLGDLGGLEGMPSGAPGGMPGEGAGIPGAGGAGGMPTPASKDDEDKIIKESSEDEE